MSFKPNLRLLNMELSPVFIRAIPSSLPANKPINTQVVLIPDLIVGLEVPTMAILLIMMVILLFMGAFMDWVGIVLLIIPVFLPIVQRLPIEEIGLIGELQPKYLAVWFGVLFCMNMQVSFLSPPFGPAAFYLKSVAPAHISLTDILKGFLPFIGIQILALTVLLIWPPIIEILL